MISSVLILAAAAGPIESCLKMRELMIELITSGYYFSQKNCLYGRLWIWDWFFASIIGIYLHQNSKNSFYLPEFRSNELFYVEYCLHTCPIDTASLLAFSSAPKLWVFRKCSMSPILRNWWADKWNIIHVNYSLERKSRSNTNAYVLRRVYSNACMLPIVRSKSWMRGDAAIQRLFDGHDHFHVCNLHTPQRLGCKWLQNCE